MNAPQASPSVLLIEDNEHLRSIFALVLRETGYGVREAADGPAALRLAQEQRPDLILTDLSLPGMDGWETIRALRAQPGMEQVPVVVASAFDRSTDLEQSREIGCAAHLVKPLDPGDLLTEVRRLLGNPPSGGAGSGAA